MMNPISPQFVYVIHKEKERELERQIELLRIAKEQRAAEVVGSLEPGRSWYDQAVQWMKGMLFNRASLSERASQQETFEQPCPVVPC